MSADDGDGLDDIVIPDPPKHPLPSNVVKLSRLEKVKARAFTGNQILEAANQPVDWVWAPSIVAGTSVTIGGPPTSGKSSLLFLFLAARANPEPVQVLGREVKPAPPGQYIVIVEEQNGSGASRKLLRAIQNLGLDPKVIVERILMLARDPVTVGDLVWKDVVGLVGDGLVSDVAIDTLANTTKENANDEQEQIKLYKQFKAVRSAAPNGPVSKPMLWIVGHTRKGEDADVMAKDLAGHHQRVAQTDTLLMIEAIRGGHGQQVAAKLHFSKERDNLDGHSPPIKFDQYGQVYDDRKPGKTRPLRERVLTEITQADEPVTARSLSKLFQTRHQVMTELLDGLVTEGLLTKERVTRRGGSMDEFSLSSDGPSVKREGKKK